MDYSKECWYCHKRTMVAKGNYFQCSECGATWNEMLSLGKYTVGARDNQGQNLETPSHPVKKRGKALPPLSAKSKEAKRVARRAGQPIY